MNNTQTAISCCTSTTRSCAVSYDETYNTMWCDMKGVMSDEDDVVRGTIPAKWLLQVLQDGPDQ